MLDIKKKEIIVVIIPNKAYSKDIITVSGQLAKDYKSICFVSLNKPHHTLLKSFEDKNIDKNKFFFIDAVEKEKAKESHNIITVRSISSLTNLSIVINKVLEKGKFESLIFDSLSTLLIHHDAATVTKFIHDLIRKLRLVNCTAVFTSLQGNSSSSLIRDLSMIVDKIISTEI